MADVFLNPMRIQLNINAVRPHVLICSSTALSADASYEGTAVAVTPLALDGYEPSGYECGCRTCDRVFSSEEAFDLHRVGDYSEGRKCADNPATQGLTLSSRGIWQRDRSANAAGGES